MKDNSAYEPLQPAILNPGRTIRKLGALLSIAFGLWLLTKPWSLEPFVFTTRESNCKGQTQSSAKEDFEWFKLNPSENLSWVDCYEGQKCARLSLPLDYFTPNGPKTHVALRMLPATDKENYKGTVLINPGGPGGSGTDLVERFGKNISRIIGSEFDILGFDPRGVGATTPQAICWDSEIQFKQWDLPGQSLMLNLGDDSANIARSRERLVSERCLEALGGTGREDLNGTAEEWGPARFMTSASVATDMLRIIDQLGQEKLQYWGFSYGTVLGQYFASMYPDRVGRLVIDGVYDAYDYRNGLWDGNLEDTDAVISSFYKFCHQAGPNNCPLYESTPERVEKRVHKIFAQVKDSPVPVPYATNGPALITYGILSRSFFSSAYKPVAAYQKLAEDLRAVEGNNQTALASAYEDLLSVKCNCKDDFPWLTGSSDATHAIAVGDSGMLEEKEGDFEAHYARLASDSPWAAQLWSTLRLQHWAWNIDAKWRYNGPFSANTSYPILISQPTWDTVCPMSHAQKVQQRFGGAGLLEQRSYGHCTISAPSTCTAKHIRAYFVDGTLPPKGTVCEPDVLPFVGEVNVEARSVEESNLLDALKGMAHAVPHFGGL